MSSRQKSSPLKVFNSPCAGARLAVLHSELRVTSDRKRLAHNVQVVADVAVGTTMRTDDALALLFTLVLHVAFASPRTDSRALRLA